MSGVNPSLSTNDPRTKRRRALARRTAWVTRLDSKRPATLRARDSDDPVDTAAHLCRFSVAPLAPVESRSKGKPLEIVIRL
jgi:hypothetical protein